MTIDGGIKEELEGGSCGWVAMCDEDGRSSACCCTLSSLMLAVLLDVLLIK
jgi:hypothetical protein